MRILMLGNSFTFYNNLPSMLAELTGAKVVAHTRGGARLAEHLNPETRMGGKTQTALKEKKWDYVILQEMSNGPITAKDKFFRNVQLLCEQIRENGATPVLYATWAYQPGGKKLESFGMEYEEMHRQMYASYHEAAELTHALIADVGLKFFEQVNEVELFAEDGYHPSEAGSRIAAETLAAVIKEDQKKYSGPLERLKKHFLHAHS